MRRLALLIAGGAVWLLLAAVPVLADGGPHIMSVNNGSGGIINADGCAGCHRIHSSKSPTGYLLTSNDATVTDFCLTCHGQVGAGATTDVETGIQYYLADGASSSADKQTGAQLGALRGGGFIEARIGSSAAYRDLTWKLNYNGSSYESAPVHPRVPVGPAAPVTSAHLALAPNLTAQGIVWGNGPDGTNTGGTAFNGDMECTTCHNPHGNGQYRILRPIPGDGTGGMIEAGAAATVTDDTSNGTTGTGATTRNYTVIEVAPGGANPTGTSPNYYLLTAKQVSDLAAANTGTGNYGPLSGDYLHKYGDYWQTSSSKADAPNGLPATFYTQMSNWCTSCHTRYLANHQTGTATTDSVFMYRHTTNANTRFCTTCHVAHGSNAIMNQDATKGTTYSADLSNPDGSANPNAGDSRLLKIDNRGICEMCHDPTEGSAIQQKVAPASLAPGDHVEQGPTPSYWP